MKKSIKIALVTILVFSSIMIFPYLNYSSHAFNRKNVSEEDYIQFSINGATYGDFDGDGNEDDIECYIDIHFNPEINRKKVELYVELHLPNGDIFIYKIMVNTFLTDVSLHLFFYNHAYVSGDYIIIAHIFLAQLGNYYTNCYVVFDPPREEEPDSDPIFECKLC
ncbi:MAG: hypothetical protein K9W46_12365 [Candidatus Heimdallarchaeum endolithica]|uniref:Uncharacterized protein n=1 Tax=Candidatus Heimdallarchaeum endolithica TaxID=2876572 RepID=A0A9Y1FNQ3_9ARCH|nr:MAG: hypothetical protein K9W46_12365 [Candidatus Heimdallarchaeum endolithica]